MPWLAKEKHKISLAKPDTCSAGVLDVPDTERHTDIPFREGSRREGQGILDRSAVRSFRHFSTAPGWWTWSREWQERDGPPWVRKGRVS